MYNQLFSTNDSLKNNEICSKAFNNSNQKAQEINLGTIPVEEFIKLYNGLRFQNANRWLKLTGKFIKKNATIEFSLSSKNLEIKYFMLNNKDYSNHKLEIIQKFNPYILTAINNELEEKIASESSLGKF